MIGVGSSKYLIVKRCFDPTCPEAKYQGITQPQLGDLSSFRLKLDHPYLSDTRVPRANDAVLNIPHASGLCPLGLW